MRRAGLYRSKEIRGKEWVELAGYRLTYKCFKKSILKINNYELKSRTLHPSSAKSITL
jgi:hypothetical protein